jgi:hypothetical protein
MEHRFAVKEKLLRIEVVLPDAQYLLYLNAILLNGLDRTRDSRRDPRFVDIAPQSYHFRGKLRIFGLTPRKSDSMMM